MEKCSSYVAKEANSDGTIEYSVSEHNIWQQLYQRQEGHLPQRACQAYLHGMDALQLPKHRIPQLSEVDDVLQQTTGWRTAPVPALISFARFFELLAHRQFPVATFIRSQDEFDYLQEPDIFHEIFGHCPLLTNTAFARFSELYGQLGLNASKDERVYLARLYWFTVEFGLLRNTHGDLRIYGGGILSSPAETLYALGDQPQRKEFDLLDVLRTPYRIDILQPIYFVIDSIDMLNEISAQDIMLGIKSARQLGLHPPLFDPKSAVG
ncbi:phenylalanine 4-monooxygenase [Shewanella sp. NFH-SH190041]|uniref:phenylalanine 4-monooxygenase n=1 Tax=Shewanella sp. NFH-SH190041 TaxID=2950245 RepID=UPI0021C28B75|nr:phenylalanine 4-monooxygenase [Shewanella sp. NFH-SH190041]BDM65184.1 phenylalanine 4-monooxygenase [Shewanella sp. NFH-SH190041]